MVLCNHGNFGQTHLVDSGTRVRSGLVGFVQTNLLSGPERTPLTWPRLVLLCWNTSKQGTHFFGKPWERGSPDQVPQPNMCSLINGHGDKDGVGVSSGTRPYLGRIGLPHTERICRGLFIGRCCTLGLIFAVSLGFVISL